MNDFTKDELKDIYEIFDMQGACRLLGLGSKIKSMIDNYCEHEWEFYISLRGNAVTCNKCHRGISENK